MLAFELVVEYMLGTFKAHNIMQWIMETLICICSNTNVGWSYALPSKVLGLQIMASKYSTLFDKVYYNFYVFVFVLLLFVICFFLMYLL